MDNMTFCCWKKLWVFLWYFLSFQRKTRFTEKHCKKQALIRCRAFFNVLIRSYSFSLSLIDKVENASKSCLSNMQTVCIFNSDVILVLKFFSYTNQKMLLVNILCNICRKQTYFWVFLVITWIRDKSASLTEFCFHVFGLSLRIY